MFGATIMALASFSLRLRATCEDDDDDDDDGDDDDDDGGDDDDQKDLTQSNN